MKRVFCLVLALFIFVGCTSAPPKEPVSPYSRALSNENATNEAVALYNYICETYHTAIISGQQESTWMGSDQYEFDYIYNKTGKLPAISLLYSSVPSVRALSQSSRFVFMHSDQLPPKSEPQCQQMVTIPPFSYHSVAL